MQWRDEAKKENGQGEHNKNDVSSGRDYQIGKMIVSVN